METSTPTATPSRPRHHRIRAAARSVSPSSVIAVTLALVLGGATVASANGGSFVLGRANTETATATLTNTKGTPLTLSAPAGKAPLAVNQQTMVKNLDAQFLGGQPLSRRAGRRRGKGLRARRPPALSCRRAGAPDEEMPARPVPISPRLSGRGAPGSRIRAPGSQP